MAIFHAGIHGCKAALASQAGSSGTAAASRRQIAGARWQPVSGAPTVDARCIQAGASLSCAGTEPMWWCFHWLQGDI